MRIGGIVLCGGRSERMGFAKAWARLSDEDEGPTFLSRLVESLGSVTQVVVVVSAKGQSLPALTSEVLWANDRVADRGPLEGIATGLETLPAEIDVGFVTAVDAPLLVPAVVPFLSSRLGSADAIVPKLAGRPQPLLGVYRRTLAGLARRLVESGERRAWRFVEEARADLLDAEEIRVADPDLLSLRSANTPEELAELVRLTDRFESRPG